MNGIDVSVVVATRNRADMLRSTLEHFGRLDVLGLNWELLVVDNGSGDSTPDVLAEASNCLPLVSCFHAETGKHRALNSAIHQARGALLLFTDDDIVPDPGWLQNLDRASKTWPQASVFGGPIIPAFPQNTPHWISDPDFLYASRAYGRLDLGQPERLVDAKFFGGNLMIRSAVFERLRFDEILGPQGDNYIQGGEPQLLRQLQRQGERFVYVPDARVIHVVRPEQVTVDWLFGRAYRYGRGVARDDAETAERPYQPALEWLRLVKAGLWYSLNRFRSDQPRFAAGHRYHMLRGKLAEQRALIRESDSASRRTA